MIGMVRYQTFIPLKCRSITPGPTQRKSVFSQPKGINSRASNFHRMTKSEALPPGHQGGESSRGGGFERNHGEESQFLLVITNNVEKLQLMDGMKEMSGSNSVSTMNMMDEEPEESGVREQSQFLVVVTKVEDIQVVQAIKDVVTIATSLEIHLSHDAVTRNNSQW